MARSTVTVTFNQSRVNRVIGGQTESAVKRASLTAQRRARANIARAGRVDTGKMMEGVQAVKMGKDPLRPSWRITATMSYSHFQEFGTKGSRPVNAKALRFIPKGSGKVVFAMSTKPITPAHFMRDALNQVVIGDFLKA